VDSVQVLARLLFCIYRQFRAPKLPCRMQPLRGVLLGVASQTLEVGVTVEPFEL